MPILAVAPHWGAWIEMITFVVAWVALMVAPHWGAWIEIKWSNSSTSISTSHPTGVRGLKSTIEFFAHEIEGRTPLGCVD